MVETRRKWNPGIPSLASYVVKDVEAEKAFGALAQAAQVKNLNYQ